MNKMKVFAIVLALFVALGCILSGCGKDDLGIEAAQKDPVKYIQTALEKTEEALTGEKLSDLSSLFEDLSKKGTVTVKVDIPKENTGVDANIAYNAEKNIASASLSVEIDGQEIALNLYVGKNELCLTAPEILGDSAYGIPYETLKDDIAASPIWSVLGIDYDDIKDEIEPILDQLDSTLQGQEDDLLQQWTSTIERVNVILKEIDYSARDVDGGSVEIACTMTKEQMDKLADTLLDACADYLDAVDSTLPEETAQQLESVLDALKEVTGEVVVQVVISNETGLITSVHVVYTYQADGIDNTVTLDADLKDLKNITITATATEDGIAQDGIITLNIRNNDTGSRVDREISLKLDSEEEFNLSFVYENNKFTLNCTVDGDKITLTGDCVLTEKSLALSNLAMKKLGITIDIPLELALSTDATVEEMPEYKNILKLTESDWIELLQSLGGF